MAIPPQPPPLVKVHEYTILQARIPIEEHAIERWWNNLPYGKRSAHLIRMLKAGLGIIGPDSAADDQAIYDRVAMLEQRIIEMQGALANFYDLVASGQVALSAAPAAKQEQLYDEFGSPIDAAQSLKALLGDDEDFFEG